MELSFTTPRFIAYKPDKSYWIGQYENARCINSIDLDGNPNCRAHRSDKDKVDFEFPRILGRLTMVARR